MLGRGLASVKLASYIAGAQAGTRRRMSYREKYNDLLESIANEAATLSMRFFRGNEMRIEQKRDGTVVTHVDKAVEQMAHEKVAKCGLPIDLIGEETSVAAPSEPAKNGRIRMIIDPIDGTEEFTRGIPTFGTLIGCEENGEIVAGMVSAPALSQGTRWCAYRGEGAFREGKRIHVSGTKTLAESMIFTTGTGPKKTVQARVTLRRLVDAAKNGRSMGGFWQHMLVAEGAIEAAVDWTSQPWDLAPLALIVEEAGGKSTTASGERSIYRGQLISTNGHVHEETLRILGIK
jgi:histidinol-phosphatase